MVVVVESARGRVSKTDEKPMSTAGMLNPLHQKKKKKVPPWEGTTPAKPMKTDEHSGNVEPSAPRKKKKCRIGKGRHL